MMRHTVWYEYYRNIPRHTTTQFNAPFNHH